MPTIIYPVEGGGVLIAKKGRCPEDRWRGGGLPYKYGNYPRQLPQKEGTQLTGYLIWFS